MHVLTLYEGCWDLDDVLTTKEPGQQLNAWKNQQCEFVDCRIMVWWLQYIYLTILADNKENIRKAAVLRPLPGWPWAGSAVLRGQKRGRLQGKLTRYIPLCSPWGEQVTATQYKLFRSIHHQTTLQTTFYSLYLIVSFTSLSFCTLEKSRRHIHDVCSWSKSAFWQSESMSHSEDSWMMLLILPTASQGLRDQIIFQLQSNSVNKV